jgi:hypothetical protein
MKTHHDLGLTEGEHASMIQVRDLFASGAIEHSPSNFELPRGSVFYMGRSCFRVSDDDLSSGALMCIGGWIKAFDLGVVDTDDTYETVVTDAQQDAICDFVGDAQGELHALFNPNTEWKHITPPIVALAIDSFLMTGSVDWKTLIGQHGHA